MCQLTIAEAKARQWREADLQLTVSSKLMCQLVNMPMCQWREAASKLKK
jgi:hypothetical protein